MIRGTKHRPKERPNGRVGEGEDFHHNHGTRAPLFAQPSATYLSVTSGGKLLIKMGSNGFFFGGLNSMKWRKGPTDAITCRNGRRSIPGDWILPRTREEKGIVVAVPISSFLFFFVENPRRGRRRAQRRWDLSCLMLLFLFLLIFSLISKDHNEKRACDRCRHPLGSCQSRSMPLHTKITTKQSQPD